jgi:prolyl 4-hydroxylase
MENLARGCRPLEMANSMAGSGQHSMAVAMAAIDAAIALRAGGHDDADAPVQSAFTAPRRCRISI